MRKQLHIILRLVMFCCILLFVSQEVSAQITFSVKNQTIRQTIRVIEKKADYSFFYTDKLPGLDQKISLKVDNESIDSVLEKVFKGSPISYKIESGKQVVLTLKTEQNASQKGDKKTITGVVADRRGEPLIGVTVRVEGENIGTATDIDGRFSLEAPIGAKISFSYIGYVSQSHTVNKQNIYNVSLSEDSQVLEEVVVVGYGSMKRKDITTAVSVVSTADIEERPIMTAAQAIQGKAAGIQVVQPSGMPGSGVTIRVRGATSVQASNEPLYVVDGLPSDDISNISPNDIESMQILKDASSAAIYGARAANGVIVIKTKRGTPGKVNVSYNGYYGIQQATYLPEFIDGAGYMEMVNAANVNIGGNPVYSQEAIDKTRDGSDPINYPDTNWTDFLFKNGSLQSHSVSVSGGGNLARFALTANYLKNDGLVQNTNSDRLNIRANTSVSLLDNLSVNMDFNSYRTNREKPLFDNGGNIFSYIYSTPPNTVIRYPMKEGNDIVYYGNRPEQRNPAAILDRGGIRTNLEDNISINIAPRWEVIPKLILRGQYSYRISSSAQRDERKAYNFFDYNSGAFLQTWGASYSASKDRSSYYYIGATAEYTWEKKKHRLFGIGGYNQELTNNGDWDRWSMTSVFAKVNYTFDRRYLLEGTIRRDGSSRFGKGNKFGVFPSIAAGWNLHEESFMKPLKEQVNEFKVRASYGLLGNENIGLYKYQTLIDAGNGNETVFGNPDITWETVHMLNIGADIRLFKDWTVTFDYYDKLTKDMIITPPISFIGGTSAAPLNSGEVRNRGWELDVNYGKQYKAFGFNVHAGLSQNKNKIESLFGAPYDKGDRIHQVGYALNSYYVYPTEGLLQESDFTKDADNKWVPKEGVTIFDGQQPGDIKYKDVSGPDGKPDGKITTDDRVIRGDDQPDLNYFANISLNYRKWDFEILFQGVTGVDAYYSEPYSFGLNVSGDGQTPLAVQTDYWTPTNTDARYPRMAPNSTYGSNYHTSDFWHFNASYCRVKYIQLGYTFDQLGLKKIGISNIRLYVNAQNPFTFAQEKLTDPESRGQRGSYPLVKTYSAGVSLNF